MWCWLKVILSLDRGFLATLGGTLVVIVTAIVDATVIIIDYQSAGVIDVDRTTPFAGEFHCLHLGMNMFPRLCPRLSNGGVYPAVCQVYKQRLEPRQRGDDHTEAELDHAENVWAGGGSARLPLMRRPVCRPA
jgi:hypothetical protein